MEKLFTPYCDGKPASISVNGHQLVVLSYEEDAFEECSQFDKFEDLIELSGPVTAEEVPAALKKYAEELGAGVVIAPRGVSIDDLVSELEVQLPWIN